VRVAWSVSGRRSGVEPYPAAGGRATARRAVPGQAGAGRARRPLVRSAATVVLDFDRTRGFMEAMPCPRVVVLCGPNGAGKSTAAETLLRDTLAVAEFVNADTIAQGLSGFRPAASALAAGRVMLARLHELAAKRDDFAFETTLASRSF